MGKYTDARLISNNETYDLLLAPRKENSSYEYSDKDYIRFKGRPAGQREIKQFRLQKGVNASAESVYIVSSSLPEEIKIGDKIKFLGKVMLVQSIGYYFEENRILNAGLYDEEYIIAKCPKGITLA